MSDLAAIARTLQSADHVLVTCHGSPDGDAVGSLLAMGHLLDAHGVDCTLYNPDPIGPNFRFLPGVERITDRLPAEPAPWLVLLDCATPERVGEAFAAARPWERAIVLDHHLTERPFGDMSYVDRTAAATGELLHRLAEAMAWKPSADFAQCVFTALFTDTGSFRYSNTTASALAAAAAMVAAGAQPHVISEHIYDRQPLRRMRVMHDVLETLEVLGEQGRAAVITVHSEVMARHGAVKADLEGFVDIPRSLEGVVVAAQIREVEPDRLYKVSLRSQENIDVESVARRFGGGGHRQAAGCAIEATYEELRATLLPAIVAAAEAPTPTEA